MAAVTLTPYDLEPFADIDERKAEEMIVDALALAVKVAPCIATDEFEFTAAAKAILRGAILRWHDAGSGAVVQQGAGPYQQTVDTRQTRRSMFWPSEIEDLQSLCNTSQEGAFAIDTVSDLFYMVHAETCSLNFGATYCSCGAVLAGYPLYG